MEEHRKLKALDLVWVSNQLEGTLPKGISQQDTYQLLQRLYAGSSEEQEERSSGKDAEKDRLGKLQLHQHMLTYKHLCEGDHSTMKPLTEELIRETHCIFDGRPEDIIIL